MPAAQAPIDQQSHGAEGHGPGKHQNGKQVLPAAHGASAHGGGNDGGDTPQRTDQQPLAPGQIGQPCKVAQQILGRPRHNEYDPEQQIPLRGALQKTQGLDLLLGEKNLHQLPAEPAHEGEYHHAAQKGPQHTQHRTLYGAEGVSAADLQRLAGDDGHQHLQKYHAHIGGSAPQAVALHPQAEFLRLGHEVPHGPPHKPADSRREHHKDDDGRPADEFFLFFRKMPFFHTRIDLRALGCSYHGWTRTKSAGKTRCQAWLPLLVNGTITHSAPTYLNRP